MPVVVAVFVAAACSVSPQSSPQIVDLPARELDVSIEPESGDDDAPVRSTATVYLVDDNDLLVPVAREVRSAPETNAQLTAVIRSLVEGPTDAEAGGGLRSAVPPSTEVLSASMTGTIVTVDLSAAFASIGGTTEVLAVGQLAVTATTFPGAGALRLQLEGTPIDLPLPNGALTDQAVTLRQFSSLLDPLAPEAPG